MPFVIAEPCVDIMDRACVEECPVDCIYEGARKRYINPIECIECAACVPACPVDAISLDRRLPPLHAAHAADNARFFAQPLPGRETAIGQPGGSEGVGTIGIDTELITALPPRAAR